MSNEVGEICGVALVPSQSNGDFAHAAQQLFNRKNVHEHVIMFSDTYPCSNEFWNKINKNISGRLGLFHYIDRIVRTLRKGHIDFRQALKDLLDSIYRLHAEDEASVIECLKNGSLNHKQHTDDEINKLRKNYSAWNKSYAKYIRKTIHPPCLIQQNLIEWFIKYKVHASEGSEPGRGRLDPKTGWNLFTEKTKSAVENAKKC